MSERRGYERRERSMTIPTTFRELARVNTGAHFLDSGSAYGRHHERPSIPDDHPLGYASGRSYPMLLISTAQLLEEHMEINHKATHHFRLWAQLADAHDDHGWLELMEVYRDRMVVTGRWKDDDGPMTDNAYNWETDLDQVFQFVSPGLYADNHLIQMHTGCDVRGGYTAPVVARGDLEEVICDVRIQPYCQHCEDGPDNLYRAEEAGWRMRVNRRSVSLVCGKCHRSAMCFPLEEATNAD